MAQFFLLALVLLILIVVSWWDIVHQTIPNALVLFLALSGLLSIFESERGDYIIRLLVCLALIGLGLLLSMLAEHLMDRPALGMGDVKLFAVFSLWVELDRLPALLCIAASLGLVYVFVSPSVRKRPIPFGPFLCVACVLVMLPDIGGFEV